MQTENNRCDFSACKATGTEICFDRKNLEKDGSVLEFSWTEGLLILAELLHSR